MNSDVTKIKSKLSSKQLNMLKYEFDKDKRATGTAYLLLFFLGLLGIHRVYLNRKGWLYVAFWAAFLIPFFTDFAIPIQISPFAFVGVFITWIVDWINLHKYVDEYNANLEIKILIDLTGAKDLSPLDSGKVFPDNNGNEWGSMSHNISWDFLGDMKRFIKYIKLHYREKKILLPVIIILILSVLMTFRVVGSSRIDPEFRKIVNEISESTGVYADDYLIVYLDSIGSYEYYIDFAQDETSKEYLQILSDEYVYFSTPLVNAETLLYLVDSGYDLQQSTAFLEAGLYGTIMTSREPLEVIFNLQPILTAFSIDPLDAAVYGEMIIKAGSLGNVKLEDLSVLLPAIADSMITVNTSLPETLALIEKVSDASGTENGLNGIANRFMDAEFISGLETAFDQTNATEGTNLSVFDEDGNQKSLLRIFGDLSLGMALADTDLGNWLAKVFPYDPDAQKFAWNLLGGDNPMLEIQDCYLILAKIHGFTEDGIMSYGYTRDATSIEQIKANMSILKDLTQ